MAGEVAFGSTDQPIWYIRIHSAILMSYTVYLNVLFSKTTKLARLYAWSNEGLPRTRRSPMGPCSKTEADPVLVTRVRAGLRESGTKAMYDDATPGLETSVMTDPPPSEPRVQNGVSHDDAPSPGRVPGVDVSTTASYSQQITLGEGHLRQRDHEFLRNF